MDQRSTRKRISNFQEIESSDIIASGHSELPLSKKQKLSNDKEH